MDPYTLAFLRSKLKSAEVGFEVGVLKALDVREIEAVLLQDYPDMPEEELERVANLKLAASETRGRVL
jgi:hypothetical protein